MTTAALTYPQRLLPHPTRAANRLLRVLDETFLSPIALAFPAKYYIALSLLCDIECPHCPRQYYPKLVDHGFMKAEWVERLYPWLRYAERVSLFGLGEPFLHPDFFTILGRVKELGAWTATSSHGMSLKPEVCERIIAGGLDELEVSMDGARPESFNHMRQGADFETVVANVKRLQGMKRERGAEHPLINIPFTVGRRNVEDLEAMAELAADLEANELIFTDLIIIDPRNAGESVAGTPQFEEGLARALDRARALGVNASYAPQKPFPWLMNHHSGRMARAGDPEVMFGCQSAWGEINIERQGATKPCCYLEGPFGNAFERDMPDLMNGDLYRGVREGMINKRLWKECQSCGRLHTLRRDHVESQLARAEAELAAAEAAGELDPGEHTAITTHLEQFRDLAAARFPRY